MREFYPLLSAIVVLRPDSPDVQYYSSFLQTFAESFGYTLQFDGNPFSYPKFDTLLSLTDRLGIEGIGVRTCSPVGRDEAELILSHQIRSVMLHEDSPQFEDSVRLMVSCRIPVEVSRIVDSETPDKFAQMIERYQSLGVSSLVLENSIVSHYRGKRKKSPSPARLFSLMREIAAYNRSLPVMGISLSHCPSKMLLHPERADDMTLGGCSAGIISCAVDGDGNVIPCLPLYHFKAGNLVYDKILELWNTSSLFLSLRNRENIMGRCGICHYRNACGGCRASSYYAGNGLLGEDPLCPLAL